MAPYRVGIIGCGRSGSPERKQGQGLSHRHAVGYEASDKARIVAAADIVKEYAKSYAEQHEIPAIYTDYREMLAKESLDVVSIITWPHLHAEMTIAAATAGVKAVHCEKPMAMTNGDAREMVAVCKARGTQLSIGHQRRFGNLFRTARHLVRNGSIGALKSMESCCANLFDWGTHWFDMQFFFNDQVPADWVIGQVDTRKPVQVFGAWMENQGVSHFKFHNDVHGSLLTGDERDGTPAHRLVGTGGVIELGVPDGAALRMLNGDAAGWQTIEVRDGLHGGDAFTLAVLDVVDALAENREPELAGRKALMATELIFATYESSRRRARIDLPLDADGNALLDMLQKTATQETCDETR